MMRIGSAIRRVLALALCVLLGCGAFAGCSQVDDIVSTVTAAGVFPVEVNGVTISSRPSRVVVLSPSLADVILALGCETQLAGASEGCTQSALDELEKVSADSVEAIQALQPDLVLVALGVPAQEKLIARHLGNFSKGVFIGVGGSFDVLSGSKRRAPALFVKTNTEWLYRILREPSRLGRFYRNNIKFLGEVRKEAKG